MKTILTSFLLLSLACNCHSQNIKPVDMVDPFIGVYGGGNVHPCATLPYSVVSLGPDVESIQSPSGYGYNGGAKIIGFSHVHLSGTGGGGRYGNFSVMPQTGELNIRNKNAFIKNEKAAPGYYSCAFVNDSIKADLTLSEKVGFHQYTFNKGDTANILLDVSATRLTKERSTCTEASVTILSANAVQGYARYQGGWGGKNPYKLYFYAEFEKPCIQSGIWNNNDIATGKTSGYSNQANDLFMGAFFRYKISGNNRQVRFKLAVSYQSIDNAKSYFRDAPGWDFKTFRNSAETKWSVFLNRIQVQGGTADQQKLFYTSFYRTAMMPRDLSGDNPLWNSAEPHYWDFYTFWDTNRTLNPLLTIIDNKREAGIVSCLLDIYKHRGWMPDAWTAGDYGSSQGGSNADIVVGEAILKNVKGFDYETGLAAMLKDATVQNYNNPGGSGRYADIYNKLGYLPVKKLMDNNDPPCGTSRTLEYSYNDYCIAMTAKKLGKKAVHERYLAKSMAVFNNLFCDSVKNFWAKDSTGKWLPGYDEKYSNAFSRNGQWMGWSGPYYEGSSLSYSCATLQNIPHLIELHGGKQQFTAFLDRIFDNGRFESDNEPAMALPWMYNYAGDPHKAFERVRDVFKKSYKTTKNGLPGNDDAGTTSAWYMWGTMGIFPVAGQNIYLLTTPFFTSTKLNLESGKSFTITAKGLSEINTYILSAKLNGHNFDQAWIYHDDIMNGGVLELTMGDKPSAWGTQKLPPAFDDIK